EPGKAVTIALDVRNASSKQGKYDVLLNINGVLDSIQPVVLAAGETKKVTFQIARDVEGIYQVAVASLTGAFTVKRPAAPAAFVVVDLTARPAEVVSGGKVTIVATVENTGDLPGIYEATLEVQDPAGAVARETLRRRLEAKDRAQLTVERTPQAAGTYQVRLADKRATFRVVALVVTVTPTSTPTPVVITAAPTPPPTVAPGVTPTPAAAAPAGISPALIGGIVVLVLVVIAGAAFLLLRRRRA
ncbi:MAG: hypothetical protein HY688_02700, partial [Chloroflexi bacterium]|nr:hypothetical protein [Chloroflexota bacterium]